MGNIKSKSGQNLNQQYLGAASSGNLRELKKCLSHVSINFSDKYGTTALHKASSNGHVECMGVIMRHGMDINATDDSRHTALHAAAATGQLNSICLLLEAAADPDIQDIWGRTAIHRAIINRHYDCAELLIKHGCILPDEQKRTPLHAAASYGHTRLVKLIITEGACMDYQDNKGRTPLYLAVLAQHRGATRVLLNYGCNVNVPNNRGYTPLVLASQKGYHDLAELLLLHGADINYKPKHPEHDKTNAISFAMLRCFSKHKKSSNFMSTVRLLILANGNPPEPQMFWQVYRALKSSPTDEKLDLLHLLLKAGCAPDPLVTQKNQQCDTQTQNLVHTYLESCLSLKQLCCRKVRRHLQIHNSNLLCTVPRLPLPKRIRDVLLLKAD